MLEIERKFLVDIEKLAPLLAKESPTFIKQGYIYSDAQKSIRVRIEDEIATITIKGTISVLTRTEYEYEIPVLDAINMLDNLCNGKVLRKMRYGVFDDGLYWEVDVFLGEHDGLIVAEIELGAEDQEFVIPAWATVEVTADPRYLNCNLIKSFDFNELA